jgi:hypothetical protein
VAATAMANGWEVTLGEGGDDYVATLRAAAGQPPHLVVRLPRDSVDALVLGASDLALEMSDSGSIAVYAQDRARATLARARLSELVAAAVAPEALAAEDDLGILDRMEAELLKAVEIVRQARLSGVIRKA